LLAALLFLRKPRVGLLGRLAGPVDVFEHPPLLGGVPFLGAAQVLVLQTANASICSRRKSEIKRLTALLSQAAAPQKGMAPNRLCSAPAHAERQLSKGKDRAGQGAFTP